VLPPLRERGEDVVRIAEHAGRQIARRYGLADFKLAPDACAQLCAYHWPGNIRELRHLIERAMLLSGGGTLTADKLLLPGSKAVPEAGVTADALAGLTLDAAEKILIEQALRLTGNNVSEAARKLGVTRMAMRYRMKQHGIDGG